jgi:hypothetical protein
LATLSQTAFAEDAHVLPAGIGRFSFVFAQTTGITQTFDADGHAESLTANYNFDLSSGNLKTFAPQLDQLITGLNQLMPDAHYNVNQRNNGHYGITYDPSDPTLGNALSRGFLDVGAAAQHTELQLGGFYGLTDKLSVGFMVPVIHNAVVVSHDISGTNTAADIYHALVAQSPTYTGSPVYNQVTSGLQALSSANDQTLQNILTSKGYAPFADSSQSGLGDVVLGARYNYYNERHRTGEWLASGQVGITVPTGKLRPPSELTEIDFGQGAWDAGFANIINWTPNSYLSLSHGLHYTHRFWDTRLMRVKKDASDFIPDASDDMMVNQFLGDKWWTDVGLKISPIEAIAITTSYEWYCKTKEEYQGPTTDRDYSYMSNDTFVYKETWQFGFSASSVAGFMKHQFFLPADISFDAFIPLKGKNTPIAPYGVAQLALYF